MNYRFLKDEFEPSREAGMSHSEMLGRGLAIESTAHQQQLEREPYSDGGVEKIRSRSLAQLGRPFVVVFASSLLLAPFAWDASEYWDGTQDDSTEKGSTTQPAVRQPEPIREHAPSEMTRNNAASTNRDPTHKSALIVVTPDVAEATGCGRASWYARYSRTASGARMNPAKLTAAHKTLRFGTQLRVTNTGNGRSVVVRINDRGPFVNGRVLDLSKAAASQIGMISAGHAKVCYQQVPSRSVGRPLCATAPGCSRD